MRSMIAQREKLERFKFSQKPADAIHAKYSVFSGRPVHGDFDWGHLQIDAVSVFLLVLAQVSTSQRPSPKNAEIFNSIRAGSVHISNADVMRKRKTHIIPPCCTTFPYYSLF